MRSPAVTLMHDTFSFCFDQVLSTLGENTKRVIYDFLSRKGIGKTDISSRFQDVENALVQVFGQAGRSVLIGTLAKFCEEYSVPLNLGYGDSLHNRMTQLTEHVLMQKLAPKHFRKGLETNTFEDKVGAYAAWTD